MPSQTLPTVGLVIALICCSAFFSSSETALFSLSSEWVTATAETDPRAAAVADALADPHRLLVTILVGNNVVNIAVSSLLTTLLIERFQTGVAVVVATLVASTVILVTGEIVPKAYGLGHAQSYSLSVVGPLRYVELLLYPAVVVFDVVTRRITRAIGGQPAIERTYEDADERA